MATTETNRAESEEFPGQRGKPASHSTVMRHIQKLVRLGLVDYGPRRTRTIILTPKGKEEARRTWGSK